VRGSRIDPLSRVVCRCVGESIDLAVVRDAELGAGYRADVVSLRPIDDSNRAAVESLRVSPGQERFVSSVTESLREWVEEPGGRGIYRAIYADETPVGFVMISDDVDGPGYIPQFLWKLLIDERHQRRGYGTATLDLVADYFRRASAEASDGERPDLRDPVEVAVHVTTPRS
jgi:RimJ/RimL family protein N-acetyltransferase